MLMRGNATILALFLISGCTSSEVAYSWRGEPVEDLILAWGAPARDDQLPNGGREVSYAHGRLGQGTGLYCSATFQSGPDRVIISAVVDGNTGGCNRLLAGKPANRSSTFSVHGGIQLILTRK